MKKVIMLSLLCVCGLLFSSSAFSETLSLLKAPSFVSGQSHQVAGIYWLPDYLKENVDRNRRSEDSPNAGDIKGECRLYDLYDSCPSPKYPDGPKRPRQDLTCYERCVCPENIYKFTSSNCNSAGFTLGGGSCDGKYKSCDPKDCPDGSDTSCSSGQFATFNGSYSGNSKCYTCRDRTCAEGGPACASGSKCVGSGASASCLNDTCSGSSQKQACDTVNYTQSSAGNTEAGTACYNCTPKACPVSLSCDYNCKTYDTSRSAMCGSVCVECKSCTPTDCSAYPLSSVPANASYDSCTPGCGDETPRYKIKSCSSGYELKNGACVSDTCSPGYSKTACNSNQQTTGTQYTAYGTACYACEDNKTCKQWLTENNYAVAETYAELANAMAEGREIVLLNDIIGDRSLTLTNTVYTPANFHATYAACENINPMLTTENDTLSIDAGDKDIHFYPVINNTSDPIVVSGNNGVHFYNGGELMEIYNEDSSDVGTIYLHGSKVFTGTIFNTNEIVMDNNAYSLTEFYDVNQITMRPGSVMENAVYNSTEKKLYTYEVTALANTVYTHGQGKMLSVLPFFCGPDDSAYNIDEGKCRGSLSYRCYNLQKTQTVDLSKCQSCGDYKFPSNCSTNCTFNAQDHCIDKDRILACALTTELSGISSDRYYNQREAYNACGWSAEYYEIDNCYEGCNRYGASINPDAPGYYGMSEDEFYTSGKFYEWCEDAKNTNNIELEDYDDFCKCMANCSDRDFSKSLNYSGY